MKYALLPALTLLLLTQCKKDDPAKPEDQLPAATQTGAFTLYKAGCDTIKVTQGRFDKKL